MIVWCELQTHKIIEPSDVVDINIYQKSLHWHCLQASTMMVVKAVAFLTGEAAAAFARAGPGAASDFMGARDVSFLGTEAFLGAGDGFFGAGEALTTFLALAAAVCI